MNEQQKRELEQYISELFNEHWQTALIAVADTLDRERETLTSVSNTLPENSDEYQQSLGVIEGFKTCSAIVRNMEPQASFKLISSETFDSLEAFLEARQSGGPKQ